MSGLFREEREVLLTVLAVNSTEARWTLADVTDEGVAPVGLADLTGSSVVARVRMARACGQVKGKRLFYSTKSHIHLNHSCSPIQSHSNTIGRSYSVW